MPRCATSCRVVDGSDGSAGRSMDADTSIITAVGIESALSMHANLFRLQTCRQSETAATNGGPRMLAGPAAGGDYRTWLDNLGDDQVLQTAQPSGSRGRGFRESHSALT